VTLSPSNEPVSLNAWRDACAEFLGERGRKAFYDIRTRLERTKLIVVEGNMVTRRIE
jgi:ribose 1,5-bisphosphokinase PhnN